jgi:hypothetical protein
VLLVQHTRSGRFTWLDHCTHLTNTNEECSLARGMAFCPPIARWRLPRSILNDPNPQYSVTRQLPNSELEWLPLTATATPEGITRPSKSPEQARDKIRCTNEVDARYGTEGLQTHDSQSSSYIRWNAHSHIRINPTPFHKDEVKLGVHNLFLYIADAFDPNRILQDSNEEHGTDGPQGA